VYRVRDAVAADVRAIRPVARAAWHAAYDAHLDAATIDGLVDDWYAPAGLSEEVTDDDPFVVAEREGRVVGFARGRQPPETDGTTARLSRLYVHPDEWGAGVGTALLGATARRLPSATNVRAVVMAANDVGRVFYDRRGFSVRERRTTELDGLSFEVVVLVSPLGPLRRLSPDVDRGTAETDGDETGD
jgi:ribosomal protein S18 acetylase RimI-like enzyme